MLEVIYNDPFTTLSIIDNTITYRKMLADKSTQAFKLFLENIKCN